MVVTVAVVVSRCAAGGDAVVVTVAVVVSRCAAGGGRVVAGLTLIVRAAGCGRVVAGLTLIVRAAGGERRVRGLSAGRNRLPAVRAGSGRRSGRRCRRRSGPRRGARIRAGGAAVEQGLRGRVRDARPVQVVVLLESVDRLARGGTEVAVNIGGGQVVEPVQPRLKPEDGLAPVAFGKRAGRNRAGGAGGVAIKQGKGIAAGDAVRGQAVDALEP